MKIFKNTFTAAALTTLFFCTTMAVTVRSQVVNEEAKKKISIGIGLFNDIWRDKPSDIKIRNINQGFNIFAMYNTPFGKSNFGFSIGLGVSAHNMYGKFVVDRIDGNTVFKPIPSSVSFKRSKVTLTYLELPVEFNYKSKSKISAGLGFKVGMLAGSNTKYVGTADSLVSTHQYTIHTTGEKIRFRTWGIKNLEQFVYGPTVRIGYRWINLTGYYMLSTIFNKTHGPGLYPISVGIVVMPF